MKVYRILVKVRNGEWMPFYNKANTEFYASLPGAKQAITHAQKRWYKGYEFRIQEATLAWTDVEQ